MAIECTFSWAVALTTGRGAGEHVHPVLGVQLLEGAQVGEVEDRAEVYVEAFGPLAGEDLDPAGQAVHRGVRQARVVGGRQRADVARRAGESAAEDHAVPLADTGDRVELAAVPVRAAERQDRPGVVQERPGVPQGRPEPELEGDVRPGVVVVVDVDLVQDLVAERVEVRAACRALERNVVGDERDRVRLVRADERVHIGTVGHRVLGDLRRLAVR